MSVTDTEMLTIVSAFANPMHYTEDQAYPLQIRSLRSYHHAILLAKEGHHDSPILLVFQTTELGVDSMATASAMLDYMVPGMS